jgi:secreted trypsin-like serine protease
MNYRFGRIPSAWRLCLEIAVIVGALLTLGPSLAQEKPRPVDQVGTQPGESAPGTTNKIVGGQPAKAGQFPFQAALIRSGWPVGQEHFGQFCGGSLIDKHWILTAAHCVPRTGPEEVDVYIGATVLPGNANAPAGVVVGYRRHVTKIISHPSYDDGIHDNDLALLKLDDDAPANLTPAVVATPAMDTKYVKPAASVTVIGWGATAEGANTTPILQDVAISVQDSTVCLKNYQQVSPASKITTHMFCAGEPMGGKDSCQGDSGRVHRGAAGGRRLGATRNR